MNIQPPGKESSIVTIPREGVYIGETSRLLHERAVEHVNEAENCSVKSHIVKHWMSSHPDIPSPPKMTFTVQAMFKDASQIIEALRIHYLLITF